MSADVAERITVGAQPSEVYEAVSDVRRMARWSPECFAAWVWPARAGWPARFVGFNRRGPFVWFTTCRVVAAEPGEEFAFDVTTFGMPVSRWSYRLAAVPEGTEVTECWQDRRSRGAHVLGRVFTGRVSGVVAGAADVAVAGVSGTSRERPAGGQPRRHAHDAGTSQTRT